MSKKIENRNLKLGIDLLVWLDAYLEEALMVSILGVMTLIMGLQIVSRYALNLSLSWSEEVTRYLFIWMAFISVSYCTKKCVSIKVEQVVSLLPIRWKAFFKIINHVIELIFFFYMMPYAYRYLATTIESGQVSPACGIPMYFVQAAPLVGFAMVSVRILQRIVAEIHILREV